ncbi:hypothetical protein [Sphingobacterium sp.]|uniref:hypothetical protein n=1 Tax=Sphingobacterium sp. TaxID=341027 RepID=UPI0028A81827|nr:hypothetical protein [Sphingobacterium sp.]
MMKFNPIERNTILRLLFLPLLLLLAPLAKAQRSITVSGSTWNVAPEPIVEAGGDYLGSYQSAPDQVLLNVRVPLLLASGRVSVRYEPNPNWHGDLNLSARRTGDGSTLCLLCAISGGTAYQQVTSVDTELFIIQAVLALASYSNIPVQLRLSGVSVTLPTGNYQARVVFTIGPT